MLQSTQTTEYANVANTAELVMATGIYVPSYNTPDLMVSFSTLPYRQGAGQLIQQDQKIIREGVVLFHFDPLKRSLEISRVVIGKFHI